MAVAPLNSSGMFDASPTLVPRSRERVENIRVDVIDNHPRNTTQVRETMLDPAFRESIAAVGVLQPVLVIPNNDAAGRYYLLAGHKRLLASRMCGREYVPAIIRKDLPPGLEGHLYHRYQFAIRCKEYASQRKVPHFMGTTSKS